MKVRTLIIAAALFTLALPATATAQDTATVELTVQTHLTDTAGLAPASYDPAPATAHCQLALPTGSDGGALLDAAQDEGCIDSWAACQGGWSAECELGEDGQGDRFVVEIDNLRAPGLTCLAFSAGVCDWWEHRVNGQTASYGIDGYHAQDGDHVEWVYRNTF